MSKLGLQAGQAVVYMLLLLLIESRAIPSFLARFGGSSIGATDDVAVEDDVLREREVTASHNLPIK